MPMQILLLALNLKQGKTLLIFFTTSYPYKKSVKCINFGSLAEFHNKSEKVIGTYSYLQT